MLFTIQMYHRLGNQWASTLLAFIALACCAIPFCFWKWGASIRKRSKYAYSGDDDNVDDSVDNKGSPTDSGSDVEKGEANPINSILVLGEIRHSAPPATLEPWNLRHHPYAERVNEVI